MNNQREYCFSRIAEIIDRLRAPDGCLWDRQQKKEDVGEYLMGEVCELIDAIDEDSPDALKEELGDVLFQIVFLVKLAEEQRAFSISDVVDEVSEKMIRRHPHVFGDTKVESVEDIRSNWKSIKESEGKKDRAGGSLLHGIPRSLPSLATAYKMTKRAAREGFDWKDTAGVVGKIEEEVAELREAVLAGENDSIENEIGDMFLSLVNLCRFTGTDPDRALKSSLKKFDRRFLFIEETLKKEGKFPRDVSLKRLDDLWDTAKKIEKGTS